MKYANLERPSLLQRNITSINMSSTNGQVIIGDVPKDNNQLVLYIIRGIVYIMDM